MKTSRSSIEAEVVELAATVAVVALVAAAAVGPQHSADVRDAAKPVHHVASLAEISAVSRSAQGDSSR